MGYEIDKVEKITIHDKETGEEIASFDGIGEVMEDITKVESDVKTLLTKMPHNSSIFQTPKPNTMFIISNGWGDGGKTVFYIYRKKKFNWFQRLMWKVCFGITIKLGEDLSI